MAAVIRVKRRIDEEPFNKFVLNCKKRKLDEPEQENQTGKDGTSTILKFAGTVKSQVRYFHFIQKYLISSSYSHRNRMKILQHK